MTAAPGVVTSGGYAQVKALRHAHAPRAPAQSITGADARRLQSGAVLVTDMIDLDVLASHIREQLGFRVQSIAPYRQGGEFTVFRAVIGAGDNVVLKTAPHEDLSNANDPSCSARALLRQEEHLGRYLRSRGIPVPISVGLVNDGPYPCLIQEFVEHDESCEVSDGHLAHLLSRIHACTAPRTPVAHEGLPFASCIARRITRRAHELEKATGVSLQVPDTTRIESVLNLRGCRPSLLHMDIRPPNILATAGSIRAIIDWSNALMGDPALEFARIAEWWRPCKRLRVAYENIRGPMETPRIVDLLYRLDAALVLGLLHSTERPDPDAERTAVCRATELAAAVRSALLFA